MVELGNRGGGAVELETIYISKVCDQNLSWQRAKSTTYLPDLVNPHNL